METLAPLSNLISLTDLAVRYCGDLRGEGLWPLAVQGRLTALEILGTPKFFTGSEPPNSCSSKLTYLDTDDLAGILTPPICSFLSSSLMTLTTYKNKDVERFTKEQEEAFHLLASLQELLFICCVNLRHLPAGLTKLTNLQRLRVYRCPAIKSLPKDGLPSCLHLQKLEIFDCPAIKSLPKGGLPSSLRELHVRGDNSEELKRQCRKLKGTIPRVIDYEDN